MSALSLRQAAEKFASEQSQANEGFADAHAQALLAYAKLTRGDWTELKEFEAALARMPSVGAFGEPWVSEQPQQFLRYRVGELLYERGRLEDAERYFLSFGPYDYYYTSQAQLFLGRIYQRLGRTEQALAHYRRFLVWWRDADPELRERLDEARAAVEQLTAAPLQSPSGTAVAE